MGLGLGNHLSWSGPTELHGCRREGSVDSELQPDPHLFWLCPLLPQKAPNVVPPRTRLGPLGLCVKASNKDSVVESSQAVADATGGLRKAQGLVSPEPSWLSWGSWQSRPADLVKRQML